MRAIQTFSRIFKRNRHGARAARVSPERGEKRARVSSPAPARPLVRALSVALVIAILSTSAPAAPAVFTGMASEWRGGFAFWLRSSGWADFFGQVAAGQRNKPPSPKAQERQEERDARVASIQIRPGDVTVREGEQVMFTAAALDVDGAPVAGVRVKWAARDAGRNKPARVSQRGDFKATAAGDYLLTADAGGKKAQVKITVLEGGRPKKGEEPTSTRTVSTRDDSPAEGARHKQNRGRKPAAATTRDGKKDTVSRLDDLDDSRGGVKFVNASFTKESEESNVVEASDLTAASSKAKGAPETKPATKARAAAAAAAVAYMLPADGWNEGNYPAADDPGNSIGNPPGAPEDGGAGSGNFQLGAPVLSMPGRGVDVSLGLAYNSRVWNKSGNQMTYDIDHDWPAPGWSLGFGKMVGLNTSGSLIIEPDGTRRAFTGSATSYSWGATYFTGNSVDGSFIDYWSYSYNGAISSGYARLPDGTWIDYGAAGDGAIYPTRITDANGNFVTITYVNNQGPRIQSVTDTLGRSVNFYYDAYNLLTAITGPGLSGGTRTLVRLHYRQLGLSYGFAYPLTATSRNNYPWVVDAVYYPATGTGYWFGDSDSYSSYGMIAKVVEQRAMGFSAGSLNEQGTVYPGAMSKQLSYDYPMSANYGLTDAPTYANQTASWTRDGSNVDSAVTHYEVHQNTTPRTVSVTLPNNTKSVQYSFNAPGQYYDGLVYRDETYDASGNLLRYSTSDWQQGAYSAPRPWRTVETDERGRATATEFSYGASYNQVTEVRNLGYGGELLRATRTTYNNAASYTNRHIFNLISTVEIYAADNVTRVSRTEYQYDGQTLADTPGVVMHSDASNPYAPVYWVDGQCYYNCDGPYGECYYTCDPGYYQTDYDPSTDYRGNVTQITSYADASNLAGAVVETRRYDIDGNVVSATSSCCEQTNVTYTSATQFAYPTSQTRGSASDAAAQLRTSATYDFNTGAPLTATDANGRTSQVTYYADTLRPQYRYASTGAYTAYSYDESAMTVTTTSYTAGGGAVGQQNVKRLNGLGDVRSEEALGAGGVWDVVETRYDVMGRISQQSQPYRAGVESPQWNTTVYDALGRVVADQSADGSVNNVAYNESARPSAASSSPGETIRVTDAWGRERWGRFDALGRLAEVVEPDANGGGSVAGNGSATAYGYNALDKLTNVTQGAQTRSFRYDSLGRLTHQKLAERSPTLNDAGQYVGAGSWSDVFTYDDRNNLTSHTDARGAKELYNYAGDPLGRLQSISYDLSGFGDTAHAVAAAPTVNYAYRSNAGGSQLVDVTQMASAVIDGVGTQSFAYDGEGRVQSRTMTFANRPSNPMTVDYGYDTLGRVTDVRYPAQYGFGGAPRKLVHQDYDAASRLSGLQVDGASYASEVSYNASSRATRIRVGYAGSNQKTETYDYDAQTGLLTHQAVTQDGNPNALLDLTYNYVRPGTSGGRTGQVTQIINNRDRSKDRGYEYDALGRLLRATGGQSVNWAERYSYDRYGNKQNNYSFTAEQYVRNFYQTVVGHQPAQADLDYWLWRLQSAYAQGPSAYLSTMSELGDGLFNSSEYAARNRSDRDYVYDLYKSYLFRDPDGGGWDFWTGQVPVGGRAGVRAGFSGSIEFNWKVSAASPYKPSSGVAVARDGWDAVNYDQTSNRVSMPGWEYDAAGNQTRAQRPSDGAWQRYQYDAAGRLSRVTDDVGNTVESYSYSAGGERMATDAGGTRTYYVWDGPGVIAEYLDTGGGPSWQRNYIYLGDRLLATQQSSGGSEFVQYHHPDGLGTRLVTNASDSGVSEQATLPFGTSLATESSGAGSNRRFTSYDRSGTTGLDYAVNRRYDSAQGRFTQPDPLEMGATSLGDPQSLNMYAYCGNDPVNHVDPDGLFWGKLFKFFKKALSILKWVAIAVTIAVAVLTILPFAWTIPVLAKIGTILGTIGLASLTETSIFGVIPSMVKLGMIAGGLSMAESAVGAISNHSQKKGDKKKGSKTKAVVKQVAKRYLTVEEVMELIRQNNQSGQSDELVLCQIYQESGLGVVKGNIRFDSRAVAKGTYKGLMQVGPAAAKDVKMSKEYGKNPYDPVTNIQAGTKYLKLMIQRKGSVESGLDVYSNGTEGYPERIRTCESTVQGGDISGGLLSINKR